MTHRIPSSCTLYINQESIQLTSTPPEDRFIAETEAGWLQRLSDVPSDKWDAYKSCFGGYIEKLRIKAIGLKLSKYDSNEIIAQLSGMVGEFNKSIGSFYTYTAIYTLAKLKEKEHNDSLRDRLKNSAYSFTVYQLPAPLNPSLQVQQEDVLGTLALTHVAGETVKVTADILFTGATTVAKTLCKMTPTTEKACRSTLHFVKEKGQVLLDTEVVQKALAYMRSCNGSSLAQVLVKHYGFPQEQANQLAGQYVDDLKGLATVGTTVGVAYGTVKGIKYLLKKPPVASVPVFESVGAENTSCLFQLGEANQVRNTLDQIYASLEPAPHQPLPLALPLVHESASNPFPFLSQTEKASLSQLPREYFAHHRTSRIIDNGEEFVLKEFKGHSPAAIGGAIQESLGLDILQSFNLKHLAIPQPIASGTLAQDQFHATVFVLKTHVPGDHLMAWMERAGRALPSQGRNDLISDVERIATTAAKALAELQNKSQAFPPEGFSIRNLHQQMIYLQANLLGTERRLAAINKPLKIYNAEKADAIVAQFESDPGWLSAGFFDIHAQQFCWNPKNPQQLGFFDTECVPMTMTAMREPLCPVVKEYQAFLNMFLEAGHLTGLKPNEIQILQNAFHKGYFSEYVGPPHSIAASQFYRLNYHIQTIEWVSDVIVYEKTPLRLFDRLLDKTVSEINAILAS